MTHRILVIDDDPKILETCRSVLAPEANVAGEELQAMADSLFGTQRVAPEEGVGKVRQHFEVTTVCLLYTSPSPRDQRGSRMPSSA